MEVVPLEREPEPASQPTKTRKGGVFGVRQHRISKEQRAILIAELKKDENWSLNKIEKLAVRLGLKRIKVYKWFYDKRQRILKGKSFK